MCEETHSETLRMFDATSTVLQKNTLTRPHCKCQQHRNNLLQLGSRNVQPKVYRCMNGCCHLPIECWSLGSKENREPHPECNTCHSPGSPPTWTNIDVSFTPSIFTALASDEKAPVAWHDIMASDKSRFHGWYTVKIRVWKNEATLKHLFYSSRTTFSTTCAASLSTTKT